MRNSSITLNSFRKFLRGVSFSFLVCSTVLLSQQKDASTIGMVTTMSLPFVPTLATLIHYDADPYQDILCYQQETHEVVVLVNKGDGTSFERRAVGIASDVTFLAAKDLNNDGKEDIVIVHRQASDVEVWLTNPRDTTLRAARYAVNFYPERVLLADIDNDSTVDILCFGKLSSGISVLRGRKDGTFQEKTLILPEIPVVDASVVRLNDDDFADIVIHNWLTNEMVFYFGMGELQFSEQNIVSFGQDTVTVAFGDFNRDRILDYAVASSETKSLRIFAGDGMATYFQYQSIEFSHPVDKLMSAPLSSRMENDLVSLDEGDGTFSVFQNQGDGTYFDEAVFGCPSNASATLVADFDNDGWNDFLLVDSSSSTLTCYWNAKKKPKAQKEGIAAGEEIAYAVGKTPLGLVIADFNDDGFDDIAVANKGSSTLSLLFSSSQNRMAGQVGFPSVESPSAIRLYSKNDSSLTFLLTHESIGKVSVLSLSGPRHDIPGRLVSPYTYAISTAENPRMFLPDATLQNQAIEFYVYSSVRQRTLSYFRQVSGAKFVERNFKPIIPARILAASVNDFNNDGRPDLAYIYFDSDSLRYNLGITFSDSAGQYRGKTLSYVFPDSVMKKCYVVFADVNGDNNPDCILYSTPMNAIRIAIGKGSGQFGEFVPVAQNVNISNPEHIQVVDFDGDGINDIVVANDETSELFFYKGKGNGRFLPGVYLLDIPRDAMFRFGDFNGDGMLDIVYTNPARDNVTVYFVNRK